MTDAWTPLTCPMPGCEELLFIGWLAARGLNVGDIEDVAALLMGDAETSSWQVECAAGHVVLLPGDAWCGCDDPQGEGCPHGEDEFDWSEENRTFRPRDMVRLRELLATMVGAR